MRSRLLSPLLAAVLLALACAGPAPPPPALPAEPERAAPSEEARAEAATLVADARAAAERKHVASERALLERATRLDPTNADAHVLLADSYWSAGRWDDAQRVAEAGSEASPDHAGLQRALARAAGRLGLATEFEAAARRAMELGGLSAEDWMTIADLAYDRRLYALCAESADGAVRAIESAAGEDVSEADKARYLDARRSRAICSKLSASAAAEPAESAAPPDAAATARERRLRKQVLDANRLIRQGRFTAAALGLERTVAARPDDVEAWLKLADARWRGGKKEEAVEAATRAYEIDPDNTGAISALAVYQRELERWKEAEAHLRRFAELSPGDPWPWRQLGLLGSGSGAGSLCVEGFERHLAETAKLDTRLLSEQAKREQTEARDELRSCRAKG